MRKAKDERKNAEVERLKAEKRQLRDTYSRIPWMDWFRRGPKPKPQQPPDGTELEKNDVLAMILAVLSLALPWVLALGAGLAILLALLRLLF